MDGTHRNICATTHCVKLDPNGLRDLPKEPAFYQFVNQRGEIIYGGSTKNVRQRAYQHVNQADPCKSDAVALCWVPDANPKATEAKCLNDLNDNGCLPRCNVRVPKRAS